MAEVVAFATMLAIAVNKIVERTRALTGGDASRLDGTLVNLYALALSVAALWSFDIQLINSLAAEFGYSLPNATADYIISGLFVSGGSSVLADFVGAWKA